MRHETFTQAEKDAILAFVPKAEQMLLNNIKKLPQYEHPVLMVGEQYPGIWIEHNQDNIFLADYAPEAAWYSQELFMHFQREDGLIPFCCPLVPQTKWWEGKIACFGQVQVVYSFAQCALDIAKKTHRPISDIARVYEAASRFDEWTMKYRNRAGLGLVEMFCEYDTGHDNDPRVKDGGIPHSCPDKEATNMPDLPCMPIENVDLSAMLYGSRKALAEMAHLLGKEAEALQWDAKAKELQANIDKYLYDPVDQFYYDLSPQGFRKYRTEHITRLFLNKVLTQERFDEIYDRYFTTEGKGFLPAFPFPAVDVDDPHFDKACPQNSWGSNSQANTAERALLWMDYYHRSDDLDGLLSIWLKAIADNGFVFIQELNPFTGKVVPAGGAYSPTLNIFLQAVKRLF